MAKEKKVFVFGGPSAKELCWFFRQLSIMIDAGMSLVESLKELRKGARKGALRNILIDVCQDVENGTDLAAAFGKHPAAFNKASVAMIRAGQDSGTIDRTLRKLAEQLEKSRSITRRVRGAMIYPAVVLVVATAIVGFIMVGIIPKFEEIFRDLGMSLPGMTRKLIEFSSWLARYWYVLPLFPIFVLVLLRIIRSTRSGRYTTDQLVLWIPILGPLLAKAEIVRSSQMLGTLFGTSVYIIDAIGFVRDACRNTVYARTYQTILEAVRDGTEMHVAMKAAGTLPSLLVSITRVGETSGNLEECFNKTAEVYSEELDESVKALMSILEPLMTVLMGILVGVIVVSLFLPLVKMISGMAK